MLSHIRLSMTQESILTWVQKRTWPTAWVSSCMNLMMIVKVFIFIFNDNFLEDLTSPSILTALMRVLSFTNDFLSLWSISIWWWRELHESIVYVLALVLATYTIKVDLVRVFIFKCTKTSRWTLAQQECRDIRRRSEISTFLIIKSTLRLLNKVIGKLLGSSPSFHALHNLLCLCWRILWW